MSSWLISKLLGVDKNLLTLIMIGNPTLKESTVTTIFWGTPNIVRWDY